VRGGRLRRTYKVTYGDERFALQVEVTATDAGGVGRARSNLRTVVTMRPINLSPPTFIGRLRLGERLTGQFGRWTSPDGSRMNTRFTWQRCEADGTQCVVIPGQPTGYPGEGRHTVEPADVGHRLRVEVGASNDSGVRYAYSALTDVIERHPPVATEPASSLGRARLGETLTGRNGAWAYDGTGRIHISFRWQRCQADGTQCQTIPGQPTSYPGEGRHTVDQDDLGHRLRVQVSAESIEGDTYTYSPLTDVIERHPPVYTAAPTFTGTPRVGRTLAGRNGSFAYDGRGPIHVGFSWQRCAADGTDCQTIQGAQNAAYVVRLEDLGRRLRLQVGMETIDGTVYGYSALTDVIMG
jgi:hypothetical protein